MTKFSSNCTLPPNTVNWVSSPNTRGTWDIFWAALTTLFLCTWSVQHPNLPGISLSKGPRANIAKLCKRLALMVVTLITPEFLLLKAIGDFSSSKALLSEMTWRAQRDRSAWSIVHSYFLNMGGVVIMFTEQTPEYGGLINGPSRKLSEDSLEDSDLPPERVAASVHVSIGEGQDTIERVSEPQSQEDATTQRSSSRPQEPNQKTTLGSVTTEERTEQSHPPPAKRILTPHQQNLLRLVVVRENHLPACDSQNTSLVRSALTALIDDIHAGIYDTYQFTDINKMAINLVRLRESTWALDGAQFILARERGLISSIPNLTTEEIKDKSKSDSLAKFLACITVGWQIVKLLIRWAKRLPASQLEVVTVAYSLLTFFIYAVNWNKPQDIETPCVISALHYPTTEDLIVLAEAGPSYVAGAFPGFGYAVPEHAIHSTFSSSTDMDGGLLSWLGGIGGGLAFGALHCVAWNFTFPTPIESLLWKIAALLTTCIPLVYGIRTALMPVLESTKIRVRLSVVEDTIIPGLGLCVALLYTFSRCFLLVETFRSLLFLDPGTFQS